MFICLIICFLSFPIWGQETNDDANIETTQENPPVQEAKEKKYVTDKLRLSLYKNKDTNSGTIRLLISGDVLDVLEQSGPYSKVRTMDGVTGWVKNGFLVSVPTDSFLLLEEQEKNAKLTEKLDKYSNTQKIVDDYEDTIKKMNSDYELQNEELIKVKEELQQLTEKNTELSDEIESYTNNSSHLSVRELIAIIIQYWYVIAGVLFVLFIFGFIIGKELVESRIRKRFQGVKVL